MSSNSYGFGKRFGRELAPLAYAGLAAGVLSLSADAQTSPPVFARSAAVGFGPHDVAATDLDGDGIPDIVTANSGGTVSVLKGIGGGTFQSGVNYPIGSASQALVVRDVNGDGKPDIVAANYDAGTISVLLNDGTGKFLPHTDFAVPPNPSCIAAGDFNKDGKLDLVVGSSASGTISILPGNGGGTFQAAVTRNANGYPASVAVGDFNNDGKLDVVAGNSYGSGGLYLGNGDGSLNIPTSLPVTNGVHNAVVADVNGDGNLDIVTASGGSANQVNVLVGKGNGTFQTPVNYAVPYSYTYVQLGDTNGDNILDIVAVSIDYSTANSYISILRGNGNGTFAAPVSTNIGYNLLSTLPAVAVADLNGDHRADIVTPDLTVSSAGVTLIGSNNVPLPHADYPAGINPGAVPLGSHTAYAVTAGDVNGDGKTDLIASGDGISVLLSNGVGPFAAPAFYPGAGGIVALGDFTSDGKPDLLALQGSSYYTTGFLKNNGDGTFAPAVSTADPLLSPFSLAIGNFNGSGKLGFIAAGDFNGGHPGDGMGVLFSGDGAGNFSGGYPNAILFGGRGRAYITLTGDFNGDGVTDYFYTAVGVSYFKSSGESGAVTTGIGGTYLTAADVNGDGISDIVASHNASNTVSVYLGAGGGAFGTAQDFPAGSQPYFVGVADFNGDGKPDIIVVGSTTVSVLAGNGDGTFKAPDTYLLGAAPSLGQGEAAIGDFNHDGKPDIAIATSGSLTLLTNISPNPDVSGVILLDGINTNAPAQNITFTFRPTDGSGDFTRVVSVGAGGVFALSDIPVKQYTVHIKGDKYLAANVSIDATHGPVTGVSVFLPGGDANNDNRVDTGDFGLLVNAYGSASSDPASGYNANADLNGDGTVDISDFGLLSNNYGSTGDL